jgi:hypothetical protein
MDRLKKFLKKILLAPLWCLMGDTSWIGAVVGSEAQKSESKAARKQSAIADAFALQYQMDKDAQQRSDLAPWMAAGKGAVNKLAAGMETGGQFATTPQFKFDQSSVDVTKDPGYAFRMSQGQNALTAGSAAAGNYGSGNLGVALQNYGQELGSQEYGAAYNRQYTSALDQYNAAMNSQNTLFNRLSGIAGTGQTAANQLSSAGQSSAANAANIIQGGAAKQAQYGMNAATNSANMLSGAFSNVSNSASQFGNQLGNYYSQQNALNNSLYGNNYNYGGSGGYGLGSSSWDGGGMGSYNVGMGTGQGADSLFSGGF